jgi:N-sulfoglucosamine sulfohydrolase
MSKTGLRRLIVIFVPIVAIVAAALWIMLRGLGPVAPEGTETAGSGSLQSDPESARGSRPNILFFLADDWSYPHASVYGDPVVDTPSFDRVAAEGMLFTNAFCAAPSCTPSRVSILTGQYPHRLDVGANHMIRLPKAWPVYPELLEEAGYFVGKMNKGCSPGSIAGTGWRHDPAGRDFTSFWDFLDALPPETPFCFWVGSRYPHRPYRMRGGMEVGLPIDSIVVPTFLPDTPNVRRDLADYYFEVESFDESVGNMLRLLKKRGLLANTLVVVTSDNGMAFPRGKNNCYDAGMRMPLAIKWPDHIEPGQRTDAFVHLSDLAPTFLEVAGVKPPEEMTGRSLVHLLTGEQDVSWIKRLLTFGRAGRHEKRNVVFVERERHALGRGRNAENRGILSYPIRGVRTHRYLYLRNLRSDLWPACDPPDFKDVDYSPTKAELLIRHSDPSSGIAEFYELAFGLRPAEELYDVVSDPYQINNLADDPKYLKVKKKLAKTLDTWMRETGDPRAKGDDDRWDYCGWYENPQEPYIPQRPREIEARGTDGAPASNSK